MLPLDFLGVPLAWAMHLRGKMPSVRAPMIRIKAREPKGLQPRFPLQKDLILTTPEDLSQDRTRGVVDRMPQPPRLLLSPDKAPHFLGLSFPSTLNGHGHFMRMAGAPQGRVDRLQRCLCLFEKAPSLYENCMTLNDSGSG